MNSKELLMHEAHLLRKQDFKIHQIAEILGKSERMIYNYLAATPGPSKKRNYSSKLDPFKSTVESILEKNPEYNRVVLYEKLKKSGYEGGISILRDYAFSVCQKAEKEAVRRFETEPGYQAQVDWKEFGKQDVDGRTQKLYAFTIVLGYSRMPFVKFTTSMKQAVLLECLKQAFDHFGGVPDELLFDNMKTAFVCNSEGEFKANKALLRFAHHYGFVPRRCRIRRPQTKGKVERFIDYLNNNFWLSIADEEKTIAGLNEQVLTWIDSIGEKKIRELQESRNQRFCFEQQYLNTTPMDQYDCRETLDLTVSRESLISFKTNRYSVPPKLIGKQVCLKVDPFSSLAEVFHEGVSIRRIDLLIDQKHTKIYRDEDRVELFALWNRQQEKRLKNESKRKKSSVVVETRSPSNYDKLFKSEVA